MHSMNSMGLHHNPNPQLAQFFYQQQQQQQGSGMNLGPNPMPSMVSPIHQNINNMNNMANHISSNDNYSSYNINTSVGSNPANIGSVPLGMQQQQQQRTMNQNNTQYEKIFQNILELLDPSTREQALAELNKKKDTYEDLAPILWNSFGVMTILLQEIVSIYPFLLSPNITNQLLNRAGCAINLLQIIASHNDTRSLFLRTHILYFLYPFLKTNNRNRSIEYLRKATLFLISSMVKNDNKDAIEFLISSEIIPLFLRILEVGTDAEKNFAIIIIYKILCCDSGLIYICQSINRFRAVEITLKLVLDSLPTTQSLPMAKYVIRCYARLAENAKIREILSKYLPGIFNDLAILHIIKDDNNTKRCLQNLLISLGPTQ